jgi:hypothetical protein
MTFKDHFSGHAADYASFRPRYSAEIFDFGGDPHPRPLSRYGRGEKSSRLTVFLPLSRRGGREGSGEGAGG